MKKLLPNGYTSLPGTKVNVHPQKVQDFLLSCSTQYLKVVKAIPKAVIKRCLAHAAVDAREIQKEIREQHRYGLGSQQVSFVLFKKEKRPSFLMRGIEKDVMHGFAILVEMDGYLIINKAHAKDFYAILDPYVAKIEGIVLQAALMHPKAAIEKATAKSINTRRDSIRQVTYEAERLEESMPTLGTSSKVLTRLKHTSDGRKVSVIGNTSKVTMPGTCEPIKGFVLDAMQTLEKIKKPPHKHPFLDNFATPLKLADYAGKITATEILFEKERLLEFIHVHPNPKPKLYYKIGNRKRLLSEDVTSLLAGMSSLMDIETVGKGANKKVVIKNEFDRSLQLCYNDKSYYLSSDKFKRLVLEFDEDNSCRLQSYINKYHRFNLTFNKVNIHYAGGQLCRDSKLLDNIEGFLQMFHPDAALEDIISEKGKANRMSKGFTAKTLFGYVENNFKAAADHLVLDDMGFEAADYIGVKNLERVQLIHCKAGKAILSASSFQEIVGQALKNLHFFINEEELDAKMALWRKRYTKTRIPRIRKGSKTNVLEHLKLSLAATNCDREVHLVVNFLSLRSLRKNLLNVKKGDKATKATVPLLWLLSSLKNSCVERGVKVYIHCKP